MKTKKELYPDTIALLQYEYSDLTSKMFRLKNVDDVRGHHFSAVVWLKKPSKKVRDQILSQIAPWNDPKEHNAF